MTTTTTTNLTADTIHEDDIQALRAEAVGGRSPEALRLATAIEVVLRELAREALR